MNKIKHLLLGAVLAVIPVTGMVSSAHAVDLTGNLDQVNNTAQLGSGSLVDTVASLIKIFLSILGIIFLILVLYAGFQWMTAAGDEKKVASAKNILISAVVGLVIILSAYAISSFVITQLQDVTQS
jgi:heme/copper-type cytochrome/quinol oxidase subunit 2